MRWTSVEDGFFGQANIENEDSAGNLAAAAPQQVIMVVNDETALPQVTKGTLINDVISLGVGCKEVPTFVTLDIKS